MKLYDRILSEGYLAPVDRNNWVPTEADGWAIPRLKEIMTNAVVVNVQNVAEYRDSRLAAGDVVDMPNMRLPWPVAWFEWVLEGQHYGVLSSVTHTRDANTLEVGEAPGDWQRGVEAQQHTLFAFTKLTPPTIVGQVAALVSEEGELLNFAEAPEDGPGKTLKATVMEGPGFDMEVARQHLVDATNTVRLALTFAHCKNVALQDHHTPPKVARKRAKAGKPIGTSYKTLLIDPMKETLRTEGGIEKNGLKKALHICRGHFATYTEDKPLFGKHTGTYWRPMHVRGNKKRGEVKKDYAIKAPG